MAVTVSSRPDPAASPPPKRAGLLRLAQRQRAVPEDLRPVGRAGLPDPQPEGGSGGRAGASSLLPPAPSEGRDPLPRVPPQLLTPPGPAENREAAGDDRRAAPRVRQEGGSLQQLDGERHGGPAGHVHRPHHRGDRGGEARGGQASVLGHSPPKPGSELVPVSCRASSPRTTSSSPPCPTPTRSARPSWASSGRRSASPTSTASSWGGTTPTPRSPRRSSTPSGSG